jgi:hypothetical protein
LILLNGVPVAGVSPEKASYEIGLEDCPQRNLLIMETERPSPDSAAENAPPDWGFIALVIKPLDPPPGSVQG